MVMIIIGAVVLIVAVILAVVGTLQLRKLLVMEGTSTSTVQALRDLHHSSSDNQAQPCEVVGEIESDTPLLAPFAQKQCAIYKHVIIREREEEHEVYERNQFGAMQKTREQRQVRDRMPDDLQAAPFWIRDATGRILIDPEGAELDLDKTLERFQPTEGWGMMIGGGKNRTRGHYHTEYVLEIGKTGYVLGCLVDRQGQPVITRHPQRQQQFFISYRTEEQITRWTSIWAFLSLAAAIILGFLGIILIGRVLL